MGIFRSEIMIHKKIRIPKDTAAEVMDELGKLEDAIQFIDLNHLDFEAKKNFGSLIKRCEDVEKKIANFEKVCENYNEKLVKFTSYQQFKTDLENDKETRDRRYGSTYFDLIENELIEDEKRIGELIESYNQINESLENLIEKKSVYDKTSQLLLQGSDFSAQNPRNNRSGMVEINDKPKMMVASEEDGYRSDLNFIAGVIKAEDDLRMKRMIFRISRGRAIPSFFDLTTENKFTKEKIQKKIFTIFFQGGVENVLLSKLIKVCDIFNASRFNIPKREEMQAQINSLQTEIYEKKSFLKQAETSIKDFIRDKVGIEDIPSRYERYRLYFQKEKLIYQNLNKCLLRGNFIDGEVWIPEEKYPEVQDGLLRITRENNSRLTAFLSDPETIDIAPPTYIKTNDLTAPFQMIVNEYGVPRYREANPALFAIVTFPFLFGVMFGDIGHGLTLFLAALYLVLKYDDLVKLDPAMKNILKVRYLLLSMGFFAFYCGWMYNDFVSLPLGIFGTCYHEVKINDVTHIERIDKNCVYPFGIDPKWYVARNELSFLNSLKMKTSVIFGIIQMCFGIVLKGINAIYFGSMVDFFFEFIPQLIFMAGLFGYMIIMIFIKWTTDWSADTSKAPSVISMLLQIFLGGGSVGKDLADKKPVWGLDDYTKQETFQFYLLVVCLICIPVMLLPKPIIQHMKNKPAASRKGSFNRLVEDDGHHANEEVHDQSSNTHVGKHEEHSFADTFVHQTIETIEFVLGAVSNTASYLRLWALSLAHAQLAKVFFEITLLEHIQQGDIIMMVFGFFLFANITTAVLMGMDLLECFLHTLRLHWVEFQSKFYKADGYLFVPFCFKYIVEPQA